MPNHFHLCLKQKAEISLGQLMHKLNIAYAMYYNHKYKTIGHVFQGKFKFKSVLSMDYLFYLSLYIHNNPYEFKNEKPETYKYSSAQEYINPYLKNKICSIDVLINQKRDQNDYKITLGSFRSKKQHLELQAKNLFES